MAEAELTKIGKLFFLIFYLSYNFYFSISIVTGPSFIKLTCISAPKIPLSTLILFFSHSEQKYSYNLFACSGFAASVKDGLFPLEQSAYKVNCESYLQKINQEKQKYEEQIQTPGNNYEPKQLVPEENIVNPKFILPSLSVNTLKLQSFFTK